MIPDSCWAPAIEAGDGVRDGAWVTEVTHLVVDLTGWPPRSRLILRKERPHPGALVLFSTRDGCRLTAVLTDTAPNTVPGQAAGLELRHRQHARVEDRILQAKDTGLRNLPCHGFATNAAWLEVVLAATDLINWAKLICFADSPTLARCEVAAFRYRALHIAARLVRSGRQTRLRLDQSWQWAAEVAAGYHRLRAAFP